MIEQTYEATLYAPLFYSSSEGRAIRTQPLLSATALMHALGYRYFGLEKRYAETGADATTPDYSHLAETDFFVSDMRPVAVDTGERTFRSTDFRSERHFTTNDRDLARRINNTDSMPAILENSGSAYQTIRNYLGLAPGSVFEFTIWAEDELTLPDQPFFRMGIKQTGEFRATPSESDSVVLNKYLLDEVYNLDAETLGEVTANADKFERGNDPRLQHFVGVPAEHAQELVKTEVL